jgi:hypothetical protein
LTVLYIKPDTRINKMEVHDEVPEKSMVANVPGSGLGVESV